MNLGDFSRTSYSNTGSGNRMGSTAALQDRLRAFGNRFSDFVSAKTSGRRQGAGYEELSQGLMAHQDADDSRHATGGTGGYQGPVPGYETHAGGAFGGGDARASDATVPATAHVPSQAEEMVILAGLAKDAAELLWEMVATEDLGEATLEMRSKAATLQAQLRGLIGDYKDASNEGALAAGLEAFDMLNNVLEEHQESTSPTAAGAASTGAAAGYSFSTNAGNALPAAAEPAAKQGLLDDGPPAASRTNVPADEPPLIEF